MLEMDGQEFAICGSAKWNLIEKLGVVRTNFYLGFYQTCSLLIHLVMSDVWIRLQNCAPIRYSIRDLAMVLEPVRCPKCDSINVVRHGNSTESSVTYVEIIWLSPHIQQYTYAAT